MSPPRDHNPGELGLRDTVNLIVGIVIGVAIFRSPQLVFQNVDGPWEAVGIWVVGGGLALLGCFCYAELATAYPRNGGDYEYLRRAYSPAVGFLFGWAQLVAILTSSIGAMAYSFADYSAGLFTLAEENLALVAVGVVTAVSAINLLGLVTGKVVLLVLSSAKILGLLAVASAGLLLGHPLTAFSEPGSPPTGPGLGLALVFVLYAFGGWNDAVFVAAEIREPRRNLPRALIGGVALITAIYVLINLAFLSVLGLEGARRSATPAAAVVEEVTGGWGGEAIAGLVMVSALGAINGLILAGARVYATLGEDHPTLRVLGRRSGRRRVPALAITAQAAVAIAQIAAVGTASGRAMIDGILVGCGTDALPWDRFSGGFDTLVAATSPVFWGFFLMTGVAVMILRHKEPERSRPFRIPLYPLPPLAFCATCGYMLHASIEYAGPLTLIGLLPLALGLPLYGNERRRDSR